MDIMKKGIIVLVLLSIIVLSGCLTEKRCTQIAIKRAKQYRDLGYDQGLDKGIDIAEREIKSMREQYTPPEGCVFVILDEYSMKYICEGDEYYSELTA